MTWDRFVRRLRAHRLIDAQVAPEPPPAASISWPTQLLSVFGAWLAALFLLGFVGFTAADRLSSSWVRLAIGLAMAGAVAFASRRRSGAPRGAFRSQFVSAVGFAGFVLAASASTDDWDAPRAATWYALGGLFWSLALGFVNVDPMHRLAMVWSAVACVVALLWSIGAVQPAVVLLALAAAVLWSTQARWMFGSMATRVAALARAVSMAALALSLQPTPSWFAHGGRAAGSVAVFWSPWTTVGVLIVLMGTVLLLAERWQARRPLVIAALAGLLLLALGSARMPGVSMCVLLWLLGTAAGRPALRGLALAGLPVGVFLLYFDLSSTLLAKGVSLLVVGALLAGAGLALRRTAVRSDDA
ncbi:MAG: DUF4401 domain-containing protein [Burkholderiaceae bacterium]